MQNDLETLFSTFTQLHKYFHKQAAPFNPDKMATILQVTALSHIKENPECNVSDVSKVLHLSKSSATQLLERLYKLKFIKRLQDTNDRRITRIALTTLGEKEIVELQKKMFKGPAKIFAKIPAHDRKELIRIHVELLERLKKEEI